jgi:hypothetical protein
VSPTLWAGEPRLRLLRDAREAEKQIETASRAEEEDSVVHALADRARSRNLALGRLGDADADIRGRLRGDEGTTLRRAEAVSGGEIGRLWGGGADGRQSGDKQGREAVCVRGNSLSRWRRCRCSRTGASLSTASRSAPVGAAAQLQTALLTQSRGTPTSVVHPRPPLAGVAEAFSTRLALVLTPPGAAPCLPTVVAGAFARVRRVVMTESENAIASTRDAVIVSAGEGSASLPPGQRSRRSR